MVITETWLDNAVPDAAIELAGRSVYRADRTADSGKNKGGGVCIYINNDWCISVDIIRSHCSLDIEYLSLKCRPFYTPREFTAIVITAVYIPPRANVKLVLEELNEAINSQLDAYPEGAVIVAGDFNHVDLKTVMPKLYTSIHFPTRDNNILDQVYTNIPRAYKGAPQGCVLSPALFTLFTHDCKSIHSSSNTIVKFADDTTIVGRISGNNESHYREDVQHPNQMINGEEVERVNDIKFLGLHITKDLTWTINTSHLVKKAQQRLFFLRKLKKAKVPTQLLVNFYRSTIESILCYCITVWYSSCTAENRQALTRTVKTAQRIIGIKLPNLDMIYEPPTKAS
ncbi:hypothetical protein PO909_029198 [Leuciscus waleckii]